MNPKETLETIIPGKTYPTEVTITETVDGDEMVVKFCLNSFFVGMYCCVYINGKVAVQTGDRDNKGCTQRLKKDVRSAINRGAIVEIGSIREVKTSA